MFQMKKLITILILITFYQTTSQAGQYSDKFANCLMQNTTERDKVVLVRWAFSAMAHHSALKEEFNIPNSKFTKHEIAVADYVQYILGTVCFKETKNVLKYEGDEAFLKAFELLGEIAFLSLMEEASVSNALENYVTHIDPEFIRKFD
jgi:hypothetical protein